MRYRTPPLTEPMFRSFSPKGMSLVITPSQSVLFFRDFSFFLYLSSNPVSTAQRVSSLRETVLFTESNTSQPPHIFWTSLMFSSRVIFSVSKSWVPVTSTVPTVHADPASSR